MNRLPCVGISPVCLHSPWGYALLLLILLISLAPAAADEGYDWREQIDFGKPETWSEQQADLPDYPGPGSLVQVPGAPAGSSYRVLIDPTSISSGADGVVRYAVALESASGVYNTFYEGIRCMTRDFRVYAHGSEGRWQPMNDSDWHPIRNIGTGRYRHTLQRSYMCKPNMGTLSVREIVHRLRSATGSYYE
jgi:hypothetical protein